MQQEPRLPSNSVQSEEQASERSTTKRWLQAALKGDLDVITLKALQKAPEDRYSTADAFLSDLRRYLDGEAVLAQPEASFIARENL